MAGGIDGTAERAKGTDRLTDRTVRAWVAKARAGKATTGKLSDGAGMYLMLTPAQTPVWRWKYRVGPTAARKERVWALGVYPEVSLAAARLERDRLRALVKAGQDPVVVRRVARAQTITGQGATFETLAAAWIAEKRPTWSASHAVRTEQAITRDVLPALGSLPLDAITPPMITRLLADVQRRTDPRDRGQQVRETAARIRVNIARVFAWGIAHGRCTQNPTPSPDAVLRPKPGVTPQPALLTFPELGAVLRRAEVASLLPAVRLAHRLVSFTAQRMNNVVAAQWKDFDLDGDTPEWVIPRHTMKVGEGKPDHRVPLGPTIAAELRAWRSATGGTGFVCASSSTRGHVLIDSVDKAYRETLALRDKHVPHGWRSAFRTLANAAKLDTDAIELFLDHDIHASAVVKAYERGTKWEERVQLAYWWDAQLVSAQHGTTPIGTLGVA
jgi:integrase